MPRNSEYLENQSKNAALRGGPSPAQGCDAPAVQSASFDTAMRLLSEKSILRQTAAAQLETKEPTPVTTSVTTMTTGNNNVKTTGTGARSTSPKVRLFRLKVGDVETMKTSLTEFAKQSPYLARKMGVLSGEDGDMFTQMKADGKTKYITRFSAILIQKTYSHTERRIDKRGASDPIGTCKCIFKYNFFYC